MAAPSESPRDAPRDPWAAARRGRVNREPGGGNMRTRSLGLTLAAGLSIFVAACSSGARDDRPLGRRRSHRRSRRRSRHRSRRARRRPRSRPQDRRRHRHRHAQRQELQRVLLQGCPAGRDRHRRGQSAGRRPEGRVGIRQGHPGLRRPEVRHHRDRRVQPDETTKAAKANPDIWFIGVDQSPCVDATGADDATFACKGDAATLLPKYISITFQGGPGRLPRRDRRRVGQQER